MGYTLGAMGWRQSGGPLGTYRVYATGQSLTSGSNVPVIWNGATETSTGDIDIALEPYLYDPSLNLPTVHQAGTYSAVLHAVFAGSVFPADIHGMIDGFDNGIASGSTGQYAPGANPIHMDSAALGAFPYGFDAEGKIALATMDGWFGAAVGPGAHSGTTLTSASYIEIYRWA